MLTLAEGAKGSRDWASNLARCLRECTDAAARSKAAAMLQGAGAATAFGRSGLYKRWAGKLPLIGAGVDFVLNVAEGQDPGEALVRTAGSAAGGFVGGSVGFFVCGAVTLPSGGAGVVACGAIVGGLGFVGSAIGEGFANSVLTGGDAISDVWDGVAFWEDQ